MRALLGTASHFCAEVVLKSRAGGWQAARVLLEAGADVQKASTTDDETYRCSPHMHLSSYTSVRGEYDYE